MTSLGTTLGLSAFASTQNHAPTFLGFHFLWAYVALASRHLKQWHGIDHQASPRYDLAKYGDAAVKAGKLTQKQLEMIQRCDSAHYNSIDNYVLLVGAMGMASIAGVEGRMINKAGLVYTAARIAYSAVYVFVDDPVWSVSRGVFWWVGNACCLYLYWRASAKIGLGA
ncbi:hypothetical protein B0H63DRAFT_480718 [Podospora didyma]|uniref:Uncharacterized protein n=1 Tax=Podospora didyma TaxID=330526 RepID=A0AAE0N8Z6_9PEZI|nr:hypothetical protein B0H63DRAFT_480718 [Podospora didyma]